MQFYSEMGKLDHETHPLSSAVNGYINKDFGLKGMLVFEFIIPILLYIVP